MDKTLIISKKEMGSLVYEKTLLLAIIIQLLIASFSSLLVIGLASFFDPSALDKYDMERANVGIVGHGELNQFLEKSQIKLRHFDNLDAALSEFNNNHIDAVLVIPSENSTGEGIIHIILYLPKSDIRGTLVTLRLKKPLEDYETFAREARASRIGFEPVKLYSDEIPKKTSTYYEFIYGILIPLLVFTPIFISGGLIIDTITEEYERKTMELLFVSPVSFSQILNGKMFTAVLIVPLQAFLWLVLLGMNRIAVDNILIILLFTTILAGLIVLVGAIIAVKYRDRAISQYIYSLLLILFFLTAYLFPNSPFNLVTRLSSGGGGAETLIYCGLFAVMAVPLYLYISNFKQLR